MPFNIIKVYNQLLEILHLSVYDRKASLRNIFNRDIQDNTGFVFRGKRINPNRLEDHQSSLDTLFHHLTTKHYDHLSEERQFDPARCARLHWIRHHIEELCSDHCVVFSCLDRNESNKRDEIRTYIFNRIEGYVVVLRPYRDGQQYYLLSAHYLDGRDPKKIEKKYNRRFEEIY